MKLISIYLFAGPVFYFFLSLLSPKQLPLPIQDRPVSEVLELLGDTPSPHLPSNEVNGVSVQRGLELVLYGKTTDKEGGKTSRISNHFVCTSCHNIERDEPDFKLADSEARLKYAVEKGLPYLPGSSFYGMVNRSGFFMDDYEKKYGDLVKPARNNLREAIQLCATECSQGRLLKDWELESILSYLWSIGLVVNDLQLPESDFEMVEAAINGKGDKANAIQKLKASYLHGMPATFVNPPADRKLGYSKIGNPATGKFIYELSCLHCHSEERYSFFNLDNSNLTFQFLDRHFSTYSRYSIYQVSRYGTSPLPWKRAYMPNYTKEKMSEQMLEDLRSYIEVMAKK